MRLFWLSGIVVLEASGLNTLSGCGCMVMIGLLFHSICRDRAFLIAWLQQLRAKGGAFTQQVRAWLLEKYHSLKACMGGYAFVPAT